MTFEDADVLPDGWSSWDDRPNGTVWRMACCDCGLVHEVELQAGLKLDANRPTFAPIEGAYVGIRMRRDDVATERERANETR